MELRWVASASASALHAARELLHGQTLLDADLNAALTEPAEELAAELVRRGLKAEEVLAHLIPLSSGIGGNLQLAETALLKVAGRTGRSDAAAALARVISQCEAAYFSAHPEAADELALRLGPLREQWEARGPGLLWCASRLTEPGLFLEQAEVIGVEPVRGGGGYAHPNYNSVRIEAVLANPHGDLPEIVRLAWLLAQLQLDLPVFQGELPRDRAFALGSLAFVPVIVAAAAEVELVRHVESATETAVAVWTPLKADPATLLDWWETYRASSLPWQAAMVALDRMLASGQ